MRGMRFLGAGVFLLALAACGVDDGPPAPPKFGGLTAEVEIVVDSLGIPHVYGATDADALYGAGYAMATDRLFQMDLTLRRAQGRRAEVLGERFLDDDRIARLIDFHGLGQREAERMRREQPDDFELLVAWTAGVNARIEEVLSGDAPLPYGFGPDELDYLPEPWKVEDGIVVGTMLAFGNDETMQYELLATVIRNQLPELLESVELLRPMYPVFAVPEEGRPTTHSARGTRSLAGGPPERPLPLPREEAAAALARFRDVMRQFDVGGSNNWAVHGSLTDNGRPLIAGDPHQPLDSPSLFYAHHVNSADRGGSLDVIGWSFVGAPMVHIGHNAHVVWTATTNYGDVLDIWEVRREPDAVVLGGERLPLRARDEVIRVRKQDDSGALLDDYRDIDYRVWEAGDYGVLLDDDVLPSSLVTTRPGTALLVRWTGFDGTNMAPGWLAMNRARSVDEFEEAVLSLRSGSFNFVAAHRDNILYRVGLDVPDRGDPSARPMPWSVADGDDPATVWTGAILPPERMPHARNPARGWIATANNDPWGFTADGTVENDPWYYGSFFAAGFRARRIEEELTRLAERGGVTVEDMQALQLDTHSPLADDLVPMIEEAWANARTDEALSDYRGREDLATLVGVLTDWNRRMDRDQAGAVVFHITALLAASRVLADEFDFLFDTLLDAASTYILKAAALAMRGAYPDSEAIVGPEGRDAILLAALSDTAALLTDRFGGVDPSLYTWGDVHGTHFDNPFGGRLTYGFVPTDGGDDTVNVSGSRFIHGGGIAERFESGSGAIYRMIASFDEDGTPRAIAHFPIGNGGDPDSPHWDDQVEDWVEGVYHPIPFRRSDVDAAMESRIVLGP